jgi:hypothetical protein
MKRCSLLLACMSAVVLLGALVSTASARNIEMSSQVFRGQFREVRFVLPFGSTSCNVTLEGSAHSRSIAKVVGSLMGYVTRADLGPCSTGTATILRETLPWHVRYASFTGTLPNITSARGNIINVSARIREPGGVTCLARSTVTEPVAATLTIGAGVVTGLSLGGSIRVGPECFGATGTLSSDTASPTVLNSATRITVRLI